MSTTQSTSLKKVASVFNGKTPSKAEQRNTGHPVLKIKDVDAYGRFIGQYDSFVEDGVIKKNSGKLLLGNETLILNAAHNADYVGTKVFFSEPDVKGALPTGEWLVVRANKDVLDAKFVHYWIQSDRVKKKIRGLVKGIHLYPKDVAELEINLPPLDEQKRIAAILDKADGIRCKRAESLRLLDDLLRATFLDMFGDPAVNPKNWSKVNLGEATIIDAPMVDPRLEEYLDLVHIGPDRIERDTGRILPALTAREERLISGKFLFDKRHVLYSKIRPYLRKVALPNFKGLCSADMYPIRPRENVATREYLFSLLISEAFLDYTKSLPSRASIPKLNREELAAYIFPLPPYELQIEYSKKCAYIKNSYDLCAEAITESDTLFHSLVVRAFKGEW